jgi:hypothetical protein
MTRKKLGVRFKELSFRIDGKDLLILFDSADADPIRLSRDEALQFANLLKVAADAVQFAELLKIEDDPP